MACRWLASSLPTGSPLGFDCSARRTGASQKRRGRWEAGKGRRPFILPHVRSITRPSFSARAAFPKTKRRAWGEPVGRLARQRFARSQGFTLYDLQFEDMERKRAKSELDKLLLRQDMELEELRTTADNAQKDLQQLQVGC